MSVLSSLLMLVIITVRAQTKTSLKEAVWDTFMIAAIFLNAEKIKRRPA
jgi:hypothetical protein